MISKLGVGILLSVATLFFATPTNVFAASSSANSAKISKYFKQLKKLPNGGAPASKVNSLVTKLSKLDPKKATKYYKVGLTKLSNASGTAAADADKLASSVVKIVKKAGLSSGEVKKITKQVDSAAGTYVPPASASAMLQLNYSQIIA